MAVEASGPLVFAATRAYTSREAAWPTCPGKGGAMVFWLALQGVLGLLLISIVGYVLAAKGWFYVPSWILFRFASVERGTP